MPLFEKTHLFLYPYPVEEFCLVEPVQPPHPGQKCTYIFASTCARNALPDCLSKSFAQFLLERADIKNADQPVCGNKAGRLGSGIAGIPEITDVSYVVMQGWLCQTQPQTPYCARGLTTGADMHVLCYFVYQNLFFACDLNLTPDESAYSYLQIFVSDSKTDLWALLNTVYACREIYLFPRGSYPYWKPPPSALEVKFHRLLPITFFEEEQQEAFLPAERSRGGGFFDVWNQWGERYLRRSEQGIEDLYAK